MNAHTATPDRPNPVIELIRRLRKATHRPEPVNDPTIGTIHIRRDHRDKLSPYLLEYQSTDLKEDQA